MKLFVFEVLMFNKNIDLLPPGDSSNLSLVSYDLAEGITLVLVGISYRYQLGWAEVVNEY